MNKVTYKDTVSNSFELTAWIKNEMRYIAYDRKFNEKKELLSVGDENGHCFEIKKKDIFDMVEWLINKKLNEKNNAE